MSSPDKILDAETEEWFGVLRKAMYGTRDAPQIWQEEVRITMEEIDCKPKCSHTRAEIS